MSILEPGRLKYMSAMERYDRLLTASVTEFCSLTRPGKAEASRLYELALPLLPRTSEMAKRHAAAALSEAPSAPKALVLALCDEPVEICAPLLTRSIVLSSADLLGKISQHGELHARAIARRKSLSSIVLQTLRGFNSAVIDRALELRARVDREMRDGTPAIAAAPEAIALPAIAAKPATTITGSVFAQPSATMSNSHTMAASSQSEDRLERARDELRAMMEQRQEAIARPAPAAPAKKAPEAVSIPKPAYAPPPQLRSDLSSEEWVRLATLNDKGFIETAMADALNLTLATAHNIVETVKSRNLLVAMRFIGLANGDAMRLFAALAPQLAANEQTLERIRSIYQRIDVSEARALVRNWRAEELLAIAQQARAANDLQPHVAQAEPRRRIALGEKAA